MNGNETLFSALEKLKIDLVQLVAETSLWASPQVCKELQEKNGSVVLYPNTRRKRNGEKRGDVVDGIKLDDNTYANNAIKHAVGVKRKDIENFHTCHIYPNTCYDERYHTAIPNLVLIPSAIAQLSDYFPEVIKALQYRSFELYGWHPEGMPQPVKPENYPTNWNGFSNNRKIEIQDEVDELEEDLYHDKVSDEIEKVKRRVPGWFRKNGQINKTILMCFMRLLNKGKKGYVSREALKESCSSKVEDFSGNFNQMVNFGIKNHGKVFEVIGDEVRLWEPVAMFIKKEYEKAIDRIVSSL